VKYLVRQEHRETLMTEVVVEAPNDVSPTVVKRALEDRIAAEGMIPHGDISYGCIVERRQEVYVDEVRREPDIAAVASFVLTAEEVARPSLLLHVSQDARIVLDNVPSLDQDGPIESWLLAIEGLLARGGEYRTYCEHPVLIAQYLKRTGVLGEVTIKYYSAKHAEVFLVRLDAEGDLSDDVPSGFFSQRLRYLR
jgi:hypothetical protein